MTAGICETLAFCFDGGTDSELKIAIVDSSGGDADYPTVTAATDASLENGESFSIGFSETLHEHSRNAIEDAIIDSVSAVGFPEGDEYDFLNIVWSNFNTTLTVTNTYSDCISTAYVFENDVIVDIMDFAGNITENAKIIDAPNLIAYSIP